MKLLFDQNLSFRPISLLTAECPGSEHVRDVGLAAADDHEIWQYERMNDLSIVSKDADF